MQTPFRPPPYSSRSHAGPQFASTPRFVFSQQNTPKLDSDGLVNTIDANDSPSTVCEGDRDIGSTAHQRKVIEDVEESECETGILRSTGDGISDEDLYSSPPEPPGDIDSEFEDLFRTTATERTKRRRISFGEEMETPSRPQYEQPRDEIILTSSPDLQSSLDEPPSTPFPRPAPQTLGQTPAASTATTKPSTPATAKPPFGHHPRFMFSATHQPPLSQARTPFTPVPAPALGSQPPPSTQQRRKPAFVLPRSPSPSRAAEDTTSIPTPFSPSSRTLRKRGRGGRQAGALGYMPGGMAAEVRSWILETGTKREQSDFSGAISAQPSSIDTKKYLATARVIEVRQAVLGSSGPLAFIKAQILQQLVSESDPDNISKNLVLMGLPRNYQDSRELKPDHVIGLCRGLAWEIDLDENNAENIQKEGEIGFPDMGGCSSSNINAINDDHWLVVMEWDLL